MPLAFVAALVAFAAGPLTLVESAPKETTLDHPDIPNADTVWLEMIRSARTQLDIAAFYITPAPQDGPEHDDRLEPILREIEQAAARGVRVRLLVDGGLYVKYPASVDRLSRSPNVSVQKLRLSGGAMHAKYFVVDRREAYVGSHNFDYRSLSHIHEIGARVTEASVVAQLTRLFSSDFAQADADATQAPTDKPGAIRLTASPQQRLLDGIDSDLHTLTAWIDGATASIELQLLTYKPRGAVTVLDSALRRAAGRGVRISLAVASWSATDSEVKQLATVANIRVAVITIPPWSKGAIPFARVAHAKYLVVDEAKAWIGTGNWENDQFTKSRNVSLCIEDVAVAKRLQAVFRDVVSSPLARSL